MNVRIPASTCAAPAAPVESMVDIDPLTQQPVAQPVAEHVAQQVPQQQQQPMAAAAPQQEFLAQQPVAIAAQQVQPQPVAQLVAAQATVATTALAATASYAYAEVPYEAPMSAEDALATAEREGLIMCRARARTHPHPYRTPDRDPHPRSDPHQSPTSARTLRFQAPRGEQDGIPWRNTRHRQEGAPLPSV